MTISATTSGRGRLIPPRPKTNDMLPVVLAALMGGLGFWVMHRGLIEDVYITLGYARNIGTRFEWGLLPGHSANTATSPLNALVLGLLTFLTGGPLRALGVVAVLNPVVMTVGLLRLGKAWGVGRRLAWVAPPLLLLDPFLVSTLGMETLLSVTLLVWMLERAHAGDSRTFGWLAGVAAVLRADLVVVVATVWILHPQVRRPFLSSTVGTTWRALLVMLPWYLFSWFHFGSAIPDTLAIKQNANTRHYWSGLWGFFAPRYPDAVHPALILLVAGLVAAVLVPVVGKWLNGRWAVAPASAAVAGLAYYSLFVALGVAPFPWYYGLPIAGATLTLAWVVAAMGALVRTAPGSRRAALSVLLTAVLVLGLAAPSLHYWATRKQLPLTSAPVYGNWATNAQYRQIGEYLGHRFGGTDVGIHTAGEFGEILYYCRCTFVDRFDSRFVLRDLLATQRNSSLLMRFNYLWYDAAKYRPIPQQWRMVFTRKEPSTSPRWHVATPSHGAGWLSLLPLAAGTNPRVTP